MSNMVYTPQEFAVKKIIEELERVSKNAWDHRDWEKWNAYEHAIDIIKEHF